MICRMVDDCCLGSKGNLGIYPTVPQPSVQFRVPLMSHPRRPRPRGLQPLCLPGVFFFLIHYLFIYLFIFGCVGSSFLCEGFLQSRRAGATLHCGARASHYRGLSCCGAQAPDAQAQQLWRTGLVASWHVGSSRTRARTRVPCIGRRILNHCATREALPGVLWEQLSLLLLVIPL